MPAPERRLRPDWRQSITVLLMITVATLPLLRVVTWGPWHVQALGVAGLIIALSVALRLLRWPGLVGTVVAALAALCMVAWTFVGEHAAFGFIPTFETFADMDEAGSRAVLEIVTGVAPLQASDSLAFILVALVAVLAVLVDLLVCVLRLPLAGALVVIAVSLVPTLIVPDAPDLLTFVALAVLTFVLFRLRTRQQERRREPGVTPIGASVVAVSIAVIALLTTVIVAPLVPAGANTPTAEFGPSVDSINPTLDLGKDLRQPRETEVIELRTDAVSAPYLRIASLSGFDGDSWRQDSGDGAPLDALSTTPTDVTNPDVRITEYRTDISVLEMNSAWLPLPYASTAIDGLDGDWQALLANRSVTTGSSNAARQDYTVVSREARPSLEQIRGASTAGADLAPETRELPDGVSSVLLNDISEVTADAETDYDRLIALERWFRGSFDYSLTAPVQAGFDGSDLEAIEGFLERRAGYCVHFASTFALMARELGMASRVVVGFLPGTLTGEVVDRQPVYGVSSSQLHAWPEVWFDGIGWVAFEPTASLGTPTSFSPAATPPSTGGTDIEPTPTPTPTVSETAAPTPTTTAEAGGTTTETFDPTRLLVGLGVAIAAIAVLSLPAGLRAMRRSDRRRRARSGDATAAWRELQDSAIDLGISVPASESPRIFADRLIAQHGADPAALAELVEDIEWTSYAADAARYARGDALGEALVTAHTSMTTAANRSDRAFAAVLPRSLVIGPGSSFATRPVRERVATTSVR